MTPDLPQQLQASLDRAVDPLDDPAACQWLEAHPEALEAFAALRADLADVGMSVPAVPAGRRSAQPLATPALVLPVLVLAALLPAVLWLAARGTSGDGGNRPPGSGPLPRPDFASAGQFVSFVAASAAGGEACAVRRVTTVGHATARQVATLHVLQTPSPSIPFHVQRTRREENLLAWLRP
jgi:hypothetical protein